MKKSRIENFLPWAAGAILLVVLFILVLGPATSVRSLMTILFHSGQTTDSISKETTRHPLASATEIPKYDVLELTLFASGRYPIPYLMMPGDNIRPGFVTGTFHGPNGERFTIDGFWDGGDAWKIRMAPVSEGMWTYTTSSTDPGLDRHSGSFSCTPSHSRGFLRVDPAHPHHFMRDDGTPFYTAWVDLGVAHFVTDKGPRIDDGTFEKMADIRRDQGFNTVFWGFSGFQKKGFRNRTQKNEGGPPFINYDPDRLNPSYHQFADRRIKALVDRGFSVQFHLGWPDQRILSDIGDQRLKRYWRYLIARYAAYDIHYNLFGEVDEFGRGWETIAKDYIAITRTWDPYDHPVSTHKTGKPDQEDIRKLALDFVILQDHTTKVTNEYLGLRIPVAHAEYGGYEDYQVTGEELRPLIWDIRMRGGYFVYETWGNDMQSSGARYAKLNNLFFRDRTRFWLLEYHPELFAGTPGLANPGKEYVIYLSGGESVTVDLKDAARPLDVEWYDPRTGRTVPAGEAQAGGRQRFVAPFRSDAVLHIGGKR